MSRPVEETSHCDCERRGFNVVTVDPSPGMQADVLARAEDLPFADESFDTVGSRIAPHHFEDVGAAMRELARVARRVVLVADLRYLDETGEQAERLRDPTHVRSYSEDEWRALFEQAGLPSKRSSCSTSRSSSIPGSRARVARAKRQRRFATCWRIGYATAGSGCRASR